MSTPSQPTYDDAQLILKLYELRREERLRKARAWFSSSFRVRMIDDFTRLCPVGSDENASYRMVVTYWEMVASFVTSGVLHKELFFQSGRELLFVWERIRDLVPGVRETTSDATAQPASRPSRATSSPGGKPAALAHTPPSRSACRGASEYGIQACASIRLIAIDIDGTLLDPAGSIPDENRRAIARRSIAASRSRSSPGRGFTFAQPVAERLGLPVVLVASNGAIVRRLDGTTVLRRLMPQDVARDVLAADRRVSAARPPSCSIGRRRVSSSRAGSIGRTRRGPATTAGTAR